MSIISDLFETPAGPLAIYLKNGRLAALCFGDGECGRELFPGQPVKRAKAPEPLLTELARYFEGELKEFTFPVMLVTGTEFERSVWLALKEIPYGETRSYKWLSERVGRPGAARAVGQALSRNPLPIVLPCHRVIESDGGLGGYSPDISIKRRLLELEYYNSVR